jgi:hypothetical protein
MRFTTKKYGVSVSFCRNLSFFLQNQTLTHSNFESKYNFLKLIQAYIHDHYV